MAIIGKIRDKSWLILVLVGGALIAFIMGDWQKITGGNEPEFGYGLVYGEMVDMKDYDNRLREEQEGRQRMAAQTGQPAEPIDENQFWNTYVQDLVLQREYEALGIEVGQNEFDAYLFGEDGFPVMPDLAQGFTDSTGMFNAALLRARIDDMKNSEDVNVTQQWEQTEKYYIEKRKREKYFEIIKQGVYVTDLEAKEDYLSQKEVKNVSFVVRRYSEIPDEEIEVTDDKLREYFEKHKEEKKYENKFSVREFRFVDLAIEPSSQDSADFVTELAKLKSDFAATTDDSAFVMKNSERKFYMSQLAYRIEGAPNAKQGLTYPRHIDTLIKTAAIGDIIGPYMENGSMNLAKVTGVKDKLLTVRHLLISANKDDAAAVAKAKKTTDSLMAIINKDNFEELVRKHSQDPGSNQKGGKYEDFVDGEMVPEFNKYALEEPIGKIGYVQTDFGFHIMEVLDRKSGVIPNLAIITKTLVPSEQTASNMKARVYELLYALDEKLSTTDDLYKKVDLFDTLVTKENLFARSIAVQDNSPRINGLNTPFAQDKVLEMLFKEGAQVGDLIDSPLKDDNRYVIAMISSIKKKGETHFEDVKLAVKADYIIDQKYLKLTAQMRNAKSLDDLTKNGKASIMKAELTFANPQISGAGYEPEVLGSVYSGLKDGQMTQPLKGKAGVYVIRIDKTMKAPAATDYIQEKNQLTAAGRSKIIGEATKGLTEKAEIIDNRQLFKIGVRY